MTQDTTGQVGAESTQQALTLADAVLGACLCRVGRRLAAAGLGLLDGETGRAAAVDLASSAARDLVRALALAGGDR